MDELSRRSNNLLPISAIYRFLLEKAPHCRPEAY